VIFLIVVLASSIAGDMRTRLILIHPVIVPKAMEDEGYTGMVAANRIAGEIDRIEKSTETLAPKDRTVDGRLLIVVDWIDLTFGAVPEQHVFGQSLPGEFSGRHQQPLEHRFERIKFLSAAPDALFDLLR
jgi:hypothetical protein